MVGKWLISGKGRSRRGPQPSISLGESCVVHHGKMGCRSVAVGHELPRHLAERAAVMPPKAAAPSRDQGGRGGPGGGHSGAADGIGIRGLIANATGRRHSSPRAFAVLRLRRRIGGGSPATQSLRRATTSDAILSRIKPTTPATIAPATPPSPAWPWREHRCRRCCRPRPS